MTWMSLVVQHRSHRTAMSSSFPLVFETTTLASDEDQVFLGPSAAPLVSGSQKAEATF